MILNRAAAALLLAALAALPAYAEEPRDAATALAEGTQEEPCAAETESAKRIQCLRKRHDSSSLYVKQKIWAVIKYATKICTILVASLEPIVPIA